MDLVTDSTRLGLLGSESETLIMHGRPPVELTDRVRGG